MNDAPTVVERPHDRRAIRLISGAGAVAIVIIGLAGPRSARAGNPLRSAGIQNPDATSATITGTVRSAGTGGPVVASVDVWAADAATGAEVIRDRTDRDGRFLLNVPPGRYTVSAVRNGYLLSRYGSSHHQLPGIPLLVAAGQRMEIQFAIQRATLVSGTVRDESGRGMPNVSVEFVYPPDAKRSLEQRTAVTARTDLDGAYSAYLRPGRYLAVGMAYGQAIGSTDRASRATRVASQFYPGVDRESGATPLVLGAGDEKHGIDFLLRRAPVTRVEGTLVPPEGIEVSDDSLIVVTGIEDTPPIVETPHPLPGGTFAVSLHPGRYRVDIRAVGGETRSPTGHVYYASTVVDVEDAPALKRTFPLSRGLRVSGRVRALDGQANGLRIRFVPQSGRRPAIRPIEGSVSADGRIGVEEMTPGRYAVEIAAGGNGSWELESMRFRGQLQEELDIDSDVSEAELELVVASRTASLSGQIIGAGETFFSYLLVLIAANDPLRLQGPSPNVYLARADNTGRYVISHCRAGSYVLVMLKDLDVTNLQNVTVWEDLRKSPAAVAVTLKSNTETRLDVRFGNRALGAQRHRAPRRSPPLARVHDRVPSGLPHLRAGRITCLLGQAVSRILARGGYPAPGC